jgi:hypothetical protein
MECYVLGYDGVRYQLPTLLAWKLEYGSRVPCDAFWVRCLWEPGEEKALSPAVRFIAEENGETVFTGVVDEFECQWSDSGGSLEISGRGLAALLLDNETQGADYLTDSRISSVGNFEFTATGDSMLCTFDVTSIYGTTTATTEVTI